MQIKVNVNSLWEPHFTSGWAAESKQNSFALR